MTGKVLQWRPLSLQCTSTASAIYSSVNIPFKTPSSVICDQATVLYTNLFSLQSSWPIKSLVIWPMWCNHFGHSCYSYKQLLCVPAWHDFQNPTPLPPSLHPPPPAQMHGLSCCRGQAYFAETNAYSLICGVTGRHDLVSLSDGQQLRVTLTALCWDRKRRLRRCPRSSWVIIWVRKVFSRGQHH